MTKISSAVTVIGVTLAVLSAGQWFLAQDRYTVQVPTARVLRVQGYEDWQVVAVSSWEPDRGDRRESSVDRGLQAGISGNGRPFPDGARMAKIPLECEKERSAPSRPRCRTTLHDIDFMVKDSRRFANSGGWGYASSTIRPRPTRSRQKERSDSATRATRS